MRPPGGSPNLTGMWNSWAGGNRMALRDAHSRVTVEKNWTLNIQQRAGNWKKLPIRYFQRADNSQVETEVPNIKSIDIDRSLSTDAASCTIQMYNQKMYPNTGKSHSSGPAAPQVISPLDGNPERVTWYQTELGQPGYYTWRAQGRDALARWGPRDNSEWINVLVPDALLRTYQGFDGLDKTIPQAITDGNIVITGTWLIDSVSITHDGYIEIKCRDMAKLLIDQHLYPPLVPWSEYPHGLRFCRWRFEDRVIHNTTTLAGEGAGSKRCVYEQVGDSAASGSDVWQGGFDASLLGHYPHQAFDGDDGSMWLSVGNIGQQPPFAFEWIEAACGDLIDSIFVYPWAGNYDCFVSVMENGSWVDEGNGIIDYDAAGIGRYTGANTANLPYVARVGIPFEQPTTIRLPRGYTADKVRLTFTNLYESPWGPYPFRAGVRRIELSLSQGTSQTIDTPQQVTVKLDGNYFDYTDILRTLVLWSGWYLFDPADPTGNADPSVYGILESTGVADTGACITEDVFDKKTVIDALHTIRDIVGFILFVDEAGGINFRRPNWYRDGNYTFNNEYTTFVPSIDEKYELTDYANDYSDAAVRSEIIISSAEPTAGFANTVTTRYVPQLGRTLLRGITRPMMFINELLTDPAEQLTMAKLIALHIQNASIASKTTCIANPGISLNDQIIIVERMTGETGIHWVSGIRSTHDLDSGRYLMTLTTTRLGDDGFVVTA